MNFGRFLASAVAPIAEGLVTAVGLQHAKFTGIDFEYMAWNVPSTGVGFIDGQANFTNMKIFQ